MSLRGASSGEISRDALLAKVSQERELRSYARRANAAGLYIQVLLSFDFGSSGERKLNRGLPF